MILLYNKFNNKNMKKIKIKDGSEGIIALCIAAMLFWSGFFISLVDFKKAWTVLDIALLMVAVFLMCIVPFGGIIIFNCIEDKNKK